MTRLALWAFCVLCMSCADDANAPLDAAVPDAALDAASADAAADAELDDDSGTDADAVGEEIDPTILTNFSFDKAKHLTLGAVGALQPLESATQVDYFSFDAEAGGVYVLATYRGRFSPNNVIAFYDPQREKVAENDSGWVWPGDLIDARLVVRARESGTHYVVIEDRELPEEAFTTEGVPAFYYRVTVEQLEPGLPTVAWEAEASGDVAEVTFNLDEDTGVAHVTLIGELGAGETDRFALHGADAQVLVGHVLPGGVTGNGSTLIDGFVDLQDSEDRLVAQIDRGRGTQLLHPPVTDTDYTLSVRSDGAVGDNAFYAIDLVLLPDNPREQATEDDTFESAQPIELMGASLRRGSILAELPALDHDYFSFEAMAGDHIDVICEAEAAGSGVRGLHAEIRDADDTVLGEASEAVDTGLRLTGALASEAGTYYLLLSSETPADAALPWARCAIVAEL